MQQISVFFRNHYSVLFCFVLFVYSVSAFLRKNRNGSKTGHIAGMVDY